jgi:glucose-1-phosphate adenylyltransferase
VRNCIISEGSVVHGEVNHSVLFYGIEVGENSSVTDSVIMPKVKIGQHVRIHKAIIAEGLVIPDGVHLSPAPEDESDILLVDQEELERQLHEGMTSKA